MASVYTSHVQEVAKTGADSVAAVRLRNFMEHRSDRCDSRTCTGRSLERGERVQRVQRVQSEERVQRVQRVQRMQRLQRVQRVLRVLRVQRAENHRSPRQHGHITSNER
jgi:hypothetical protein